MTSWTTSAGSRSSVSMTTSRRLLPPCGPVGPVNGRAPPRLVRAVPGLQPPPQLLWFDPQPAERHAERAQLLEEVPRRAFVQDARDDDRTGPCMSQATHERGRRPGLERIASGIIVRFGVAHSHLVDVEVAAGLAAQQVGVQRPRRRRLTDRGRSVQPQHLALRGAHGSRLRFSRACQRRTTLVHQILPPSASATADRWRGCQPTPGPRRDRSTVAHPRRPSLATSCGDASPPGSPRYRTH